MTEVAARSRAWRRTRLVESGSSRRLRPTLGASVRVVPAMLASALLTHYPLAADAATEGKKVIFGMLVVGLVFIGMIALGQLSRWARHRRH